MTNNPGWLDQAEIMPIRGKIIYPYLKGKKHQLPVTKQLWHTTEGSTIAGAVAAYKSRAGFSNGVHPHMTVNPLKKRIVQHISLFKSSYSLYDNNDQRGVIQVEVVGFAKDTGNWPDSTYEWLGEFVAAPIGAQCPLIDLDTWPRFFGAGEGIVLASKNSTIRFDRAGFDGFIGQVGHQDAPPPDNHWDPGKWRPEVIARSAKLAGWVRPTIQGTLIVNILKLGGHGPYVVALQELLNAKSSAGLKLDGDFGPATEAAVKRYQTMLGIIADGIWGPASRDASNASVINPPQPVPQPTPPQPAPQPTPQPAPVDMDALVNTVVTKVLEQIPRPIDETTLVDRVTAEIVARLQKV